VRKRPLNKKESTKNEEDIVDTHANCLTVHETKLKVSLWWLGFMHSQSSELSTWQDTKTDLLLHYYRST